MIPRGAARRQRPCKRRISAFMRRWGTFSLRVSLGIIFIWFGILKPIGISAAAPSAKRFGSGGISAGVQCALEYTDKAILDSGMSADAFFKAQ